MKLKDLVPDVRSGKELKLLNMFSAKDANVVLKSTLSKQTVTIKNSSTGEIIGKRSLIQK
jgi:hypothetical protein